MNICRLPSARRTRRLISAIKSLEPGGGCLLQNFSHSASGARSANDDDGITNGPWVTEATRPSKIEISHAVWPTSSRNVIDRNRPRLTSASSALTRALSASIIPARPLAHPSTPPFLAVFAPCWYDGGNGRGVNRLYRTERMILPPNRLQAWGKPK